MAACPGWCGQCYSNRRGRSNFRGHSGYRKARPRLLPWEAALQKPSADDAVSGVAPHAFSDDEFVRRWTNLFHYLADVKWDDGSSRETATLMLVFDSGRLKACINDRAMSRTAWVSGESLEGLFDRLDAGLGADSLEWRAAKAWGRKGK